MAFDVSRDELMIRFAERSLPFSFLSDGYRNMVAMVADIAIRCATLNPHLREKSSQETPGVVLIDEIDLHLHPRWQRRVVDDLLRTFPKIQFFGTTHSPFVIQSLPPIEGVQLLNLDDEHAEEFANKSVEDISEEIQGVELPQRSKRFKDMMEAAEEYFAILSRSQATTAEERERLKVRARSAEHAIQRRPRLPGVLEDAADGLGPRRGGRLMRPVNRGDWPKDGRRNRYSLCRLQRGQRSL